MAKNRFILPILVSIACFATFAEAQTSVGGRAGTTGLGLEVGFGWSEQVDARLVASGFDYDDDFSSSRVRYDGEAELRFLSALIDWHPGGSGFRFSAGLVWNDSTIRGSARVRDIIEDQAPEILDLGFTIPGDLGTVNAEARGDDLAPYVGIGWGKVAGRTGLGFSFDLGAFVFGDPEVDLTLDTPLPVDAIPNGRALIDEALASERAELEEELEDYDVYPVVSFGVFYRF